jgi:glycosyltransferase involved in cell wall biosynthesis
MIVKNEEENLKKCIESLASLREEVSTELIIVDTGSDDKTPLIAEKFADKFLRYEWNNDFSAARNVAVEAAEGEWYMTIDADEELCNHEELVNFLKNNPNRDKYALASYIQRNYRDDGSFSDFNAVRLAKRTPELRYNGKIHEVFSVRGALYITKA